MWTSHAMTKGRAPQIRRWFAVVLAIGIALPVPVQAQMVGGAGVPGPDQMGLPGQPVTPRVTRELAEFPIITIVEPRNGAIATHQDQGITITYRDPRDELDTNSFRVFVNGIDRTSEFQVTTGGATWKPQPGGRQELGRQTSLDNQRLEDQGRDTSLRGTSLDSTGLRGTSLDGTRLQESRPVLREGQNVIVASIKNASGNMATTSAAFVLDTSTLLTTRIAPRSPLERAFLQPPSPPATEVERRGTPTAPSIFPPYLFIRSTYSCSTEEAPWRTMGNPGIRRSTSSRMSKRRGGADSPGFTLNLNAPCEVPMEMARLSTPVFFTKSSTSLGSV